MSYAAVKGTHDLFADEADAYAYIESLFKAVAELFGYRAIETPILEHTEVFDRSTGESSDVVRKEMYTFLDKGNRSVTLRPEGTAGVARSIVENKLYATRDLPLKVYYVGPAFRYERPQLGRYRQFIQAGVEAVGEDSPYLDAECICLAMAVLSMLGFEKLKVKVNTLGDEKTRAAYKEALREYFSKRIDDMCEDCHERLRLNPMRILDCKVEADQKIAEGAPKMRDFLSEEADTRFYKTLSLLNEEGIEYEIDDRLVRGLDYYGQIVFEVHALSPSGLDYGALLGGGHYDGMLGNFGGPKENDSGVGFAMGIERLYSLLKEMGRLDDAGHCVDIYAMPIGEEVLDDGFSLIGSLRAAGFAIEMPYHPSKMGAMFKKAARSGAKLALIFGRDELDKGVVQLKNLKTFTQQEIAIEDLEEALEHELSALEEEEHDHEHCHCHDHGEQA